MKAAESVFSGFMFFGDLFYLCRFKGLRSEKENTKGKGDFFFIVHHKSFPLGSRLSKKNFLLGFFFFFNFVLDGSRTTIALRKKKKTPKVLDL